MHDRIIDRGGGEPGILSLGALRSAIDRARWGPFQWNGTVYERAALLMRGIGQDHPFLDGNKRTSFEAADTFLGHNGCQIRASADDVVEFTLAVARAELSVGEITHWFRVHTLN